MPQTKFVRLEVTDPNNQNDLPQKLRQYLLQAQTIALNAHGVFQVAVSGGSLPKSLGSALLGQEELGFQFGKWQIYLADERAVPLDHEDSNYRLVNEEWIDKIAEGLPRPTLIPIDTSLLDDMDKLADDYQTKLIKQFVHRDSVVVPIFDLILLGCGPDGHTCSLFPGRPTSKTTTHQDWVLSVIDSPKPPPKRITLSMAVVIHATHIAFVATGKGKEDIMHQIFDLESDLSLEFSEKEEEKLLPCSIVNRHGKQVTWFTDEPAVTKVDRRAVLERSRIQL